MSSASIARTGPAPWVGYGCAVAVVLLWSGFSLSGRHAALGAGVRPTPWDLGALRYSISFVIAAVAWLAGYGRGLPWRRALATGVLAGLCFPLPAYLGFTFAPAAHGAVILSGTLPFLVAIGMWALSGERWSRARLLSLLVLLGGILLLGIEAYVRGARPGAWRGDLLFLVSSVAWAAYTIGARRWGATHWQAVVSVGLWCGVLYLPVWLLFLPSTLGQAPAGEVVYQAVFQGVLATVVALMLFTRALDLLGAARLTTITALVPGVAGVLSVPLLGERVGAVELLGLALVCVAVALGVRGDRS
jgi:drug/metabolite transporter (DMT)-like permease